MGTGEVNRIVEEAAYVATMKIYYTCRLNAKPLFWCTGSENGQLMSCNGQKSCQQAAAVVVVVVAFIQSCGHKTK